jgi:hypothetical protein
MSDRQGIIYYAFNLLEEIDQPGEWYLNRDTGILYFYPPGDPSEALIEIGMLAGPMLALDGVSHVRLEGMVFDLGRHDGLHVTDSQDCLIAGCTVQRMAGQGRVMTEDNATGCSAATFTRWGGEAPSYRAATGRA